MKINGIQNYPMQTPLKQRVATNSIGFRADDSSAQDEEKKSGFSFKKATNLLGVLAWLAVAGLGVYKTGLFRKTSPESISQKAKKLADQYKDMALETGEGSREKIDELFKGHGIAKWFYKMGNWSNNMTKRMGKELYNNLTYALGTLVVMPLVIWTSPFGKKDSSTSDKAYATLRQPFSVLATFTLQAMFDKMFNRYTPRAIEKNVIESEEVRNSAKENGGKISAKLYNKIKYNMDEVQRIFKEELPNISVKDGGLKGILDKDLAKQLLELDPGMDKDADSYNEHFEKIKKLLKMNDSELNDELVHNPNKLKLVKKLKTFQ